jgi:hypothetical protein
MLRITLCTILAIGFVVSTTSLQAAEPVEDPLLAAARISREDPFLSGANSEIEKRALERTHNIAYRFGKRLTLLTGGGPISFVDDAPTVVVLGGMGFETTEDPECTGKKVPCSTFKVLAHLEKQGLFVVQHAWKNSVDYHLISQVNGFTSVFSDFPYISPDGEYVFGDGGYEIVADDTPNPFEGKPHIEVWTRIGWRYVPDWEGAPHTPPSGKPVYKFDRWVSNEGDLEIGEALLEAHVEVDGKITARFQLRKSDGPDQLEIADLP